MKEPENSSDPLEGATVVRKVDLNRLAQEAREAKKRKRVVSHVVLITHQLNTYLVIPMGGGFRRADGDSINEDGISATAAKQKILNLFGEDAYLAPAFWEQVLRMAKVGVKVVLELGAQPIVSQDPEVTGKFPIGLKG